jgi:hypothetical protein
LIYNSRSDTLLYPMSFSLTFSISRAFAFPETNPSRIGACWYPIPAKRHTNRAAIPGALACFSHIKQFTTTVAILHIVPVTVNVVALTCECKRKCQSCIS